MRIWRCCWAHGFTRSGPSRSRSVRDVREWTGRGACPTTASYVLRSGGGLQMSFGLYIAGFAILIIGLAMGAHFAHMPGRWIAVGVVVMIGLGIVKGVAKTRRPDPS